MPLIPGTKLGPYEIQSSLGAGGMGEVYRARDTRLDRTVAIKILPAQFSENAEAKHRFEREARTISSLNHPNICALYDVGHQTGTDYLVMEFLDGETLAHRLRKGPLPLGQVLKYGIEICEGLEKAHESGVVHRDLKPPNIMLTKSGAKLMDFGLAKPASPALGAASSPEGALTPSTPTISVASLGAPASPLTQKGHVLGTFQYMAPEQLHGGETDARSDIFAFGAVLYEMATGKRAFEGKSQLSVATAILEKEPEPVSSLQKGSPPVLDHVVATCLAKNPDDRWRCAADVARELAWISQTPAADAAGRWLQRHRIIERAAWLAAIMVLLAITILRPWKSSQPPAIIRFSIAPPEKSTFGYGLAVSPDGQQVALIAASSPNETALSIRTLNSSESRLLHGTEGAQFPFWSPDSNRIGFFADNKLKTIDLRSGAVQTLADAGEGRGGDWNPNGDIVFAPSLTGAILRVSANGGNPLPVTVLDVRKTETTHRWPHFLPDGNHFTFVARTIPPKTAETIYIGSLHSLERQELFAASSGVQYTPPGHLVFVRGRTLFVQAFNVKNLRVTGEPLAVLDGIQPEGEAGPTYYAAFSVNGGSLAYSKGAAQQSQLVWWDRTGKKLQAASAPGTYDEPALSPDGRRVALDVLGSRNSVWVLDLARGALSRLSFEDRALCALWSPDGQQIAYRAVETTGSGFEFSIVVRPSSGTGNTTSLIRLSSQDRGDQMFPDSWSPDGRMLVVENGVGEFGNRPDAAQRVYVGLWLLPLGGDGKLQPFLSGPFNAAHASLSPDGRWLAYSSDETGRSEIYVQDFPRRSKKIQVSTNGGDQASWNHNGKELFYLSADQKLMVVAVSTQGEFKAGVPHMLFHAPISSGGLLGPRINYAVGPDGTRILMNVLLENSQQQSITMVVSWIEELNKK